MTYNTQIHFSRFTSLLTIKRLKNIKNIEMYLHSKYKHIAMKAVNIYSDIFFIILEHFKALPVDSEVPLYYLLTILYTFIII